MTFFEFCKLVAVASTVLLLLGQTIPTVEACSCVDLSVCETFDGADVVLRGTVLPSRPRRRHRERRHRPRSDGRVKYTLEVTAIYKGEPDVSDAQEISFTTNDNGAACGVTLDEGEEYLVDLYQTDDGLTANLCGFVGEWNSVSDEGKASVEAGCEDDPCEGNCREFQECLLYGTSQYYCADSCDPSPCAEDEVCSFGNLQCLVNPCPPPSRCDPASP